MKFYIEYESESGDVSLDNTLQAISQKYKYKLLWEMREFEDRVNDDNGSFIFTRDCRLQYYGYDVVLAAEIEAKIHAIDWTKW